MDQPKKLPRHLAIIMDGNGRWAQHRGLPRVAGHAAGAKAVRNVVTYCRKLGIPVLTLYAFSTQNWLRPMEEIDALMKLFASTIRAERPTLLSTGIRLRAIGEIQRLPAPVRDALEELIADTAHLTGMDLVLALSYGGQEEITAAAREAMAQVARGELRPEDLDVERFGSLLQSAEYGPVDLLIRTSGEERISNFLIWSLAYTEFCFTKTLWPDIGEKEIDQALAAYAGRDRRFGKVR